MIHIWRILAMVSTFFLTFFHSFSHSYTQTHTHLLFLKYSYVTFAQCHPFEWQKQLILKECYGEELISMAFCMLSGASNCLLLFWLSFIFPQQGWVAIYTDWKEQIASMPCRKLLQIPTKPKYNEVTKCMCL